MKRRLALVLVGLVALLGLPLMSFAQSAEAVTELARYFPSDTGMFIGIRTDDDYIDTLNSLAQRLEAITDGDFSMPGHLSDLLDMSVASVVEEGTFDNTIRTWLGNSAAFGVTDLGVMSDDDEDNDQEVALLAVDITDANAAQTFIDDVLTPRVEERDTVVESFEGDGYTGYSFSGGESTAYFVLYADVMFIGASEEVLPLDGLPADTLAENEAFQTGVSNLPAESYNLILYLDTPTFLEYAVVEAQEQSERRQMADSTEAAAMEAILPFLDAVDATVIGATNLDERTLALDVAQQTDASALAAAGVPVNTRPPVSADFAQYIPAGMPLVIHGTDLNGAFNDLITTMQNIAAQADPESDPEAQINFALAFVGAALGGLNVQDDLLGWMTGDFALVASLNESFPTSGREMSRLETLPLDFGLIIEATDADAAANVVTSIQTVLENTAENDPDALTLDIEDVGGGTMVLVTTQGGDDIEGGDDMPFPVQVAIGSNANVFAVGTPAVVRHALSPDGGLDTDPLFQEAAAFVLPDATQVWYLAGETLMPLADLAELRMDEGRGDDEDLRTLLTLFHSSSISQMTLEDGTAVTRLVMTLPE